MFGSIHRVEDMLFLEVDILVSIDWLGDICVIFSLFFLQYLVLIFCWKFVVKLYLLSCKFCFYFTTCLPRLELSKVCVSARMLTMCRYNISNARSHFAIGPFRTTTNTSTQILNISITEIWYRYGHIINFEPLFLFSLCLFNSPLHGWNIVDTAIDPINQSASFTIFENLMDIINFG